MRKDAFNNMAGRLKTQKTQDIHQTDPDLISIFQQELQFEDKLTG
jgi:hypothetical protein